MHQRAQLFAIRAQISDFQRIGHRRGSESHALAIPHLPHAGHARRNIGNRAPATRFFQPRRAARTIGRNDGHFRRWGRFQAAARNHHPPRFNPRRQIFFFQSGFAHQPMGDAAQQFFLRAAAIMPAPP